MTTTADTRRNDLIWNLTGKAITGLAGLGITAAIAVGGWSLKMQNDTSDGLNELSTSLRLLTVEVTNIERRWVEQMERLAERDRSYESRLAALEQFGPGSGPRVTPAQLDTKIADAIESTNRVIDRLATTIQNQTVLLARYDERINRLEEQGRNP